MNPPFHSPLHVKSNPLTLTHTTHLLDKKKDSSSEARSSPSQTAGPIRTSTVRSEDRGEREAVHKSIRRINSANTLRPWRAGHVSPPSSGARGSTDRSSPPTLAPLLIRPHESDRQQQQPSADHSPSGIVRADPQPLLQKGHHRPSLAESYSTPNASLAPKMQQPMSASEGVSSPESTTTKRSARQLGHSLASTVRAHLHTPHRSSDHHSSEETTGGMHIKASYHKVLRRTGTHKRSPLQSTTPHLSSYHQSGSSSPRSPSSPVRLSAETEEKGIDDRSVLPNNSSIEMIQASSTTSGTATDLYSPPLVGSSSTSEGTSSTVGSSALLPPMVPLQPLGTIPPYDDLTDTPTPTLTSPTKGSSSNLTEGNIAAPWGTGDSRPPETAVMETTPLEVQPYTMDIPVPLVPQRPPIRTLRIQFTPFTSLSSSSSSSSSLGTTTPKSFRISALLRTVDEKIEGKKPLSELDTLLPRMSFPIGLGFCDSSNKLELLPDGWDALSCPLPSPLAAVCYPQNLSCLWDGIPELILTGAGLMMGL